MFLDEINIPQEETRIIQELLRCILYAAPSWHQNSINRNNRLSIEDRRNIIVPLDFITTSYENEGLFRGWKESTFRLYPVGNIGKNACFKDFDESAHLPVIMQYLSRIGIDAECKKAHFEGHYGTFQKQIDNPEEFCRREKVRLKYNRLSKICIGTFTYLELRKIPEDTEIFFGKQKKLIDSVSVQNQMQEFLKTNLYKDGKLFCEKIKRADYKDKLIATIDTGRRRYHCYSTRLEWESSNEDTYSTSLQFSSIGLLPLNENFQKIGLLLFVADMESQKAGLSIEEAIGSGFYRLGITDDRNFCWLVIDSQKFNGQSFPETRLSAW